jgi:hypothetical protein
MEISDYAMLEGISAAFTDFKKGRKNAKNTGDRYGLKITLVNKILSHERFIVFLT